MTKSEFEQRVRECTERLWRCAWAILRNEADAGDAVQDALLQAWRKLPGLRQEQHFETWLMRILINRSRSILCRRVRMVPSEIPDRPAPDTGLSPEMRDAIERLPVRLRLPFLLRHIGGYSIAEIAGMQNLSYPAARRRIESATRMLRKALEEEEQI